MLNNKQVAGKFDLLAKLMELHDENPFKIKSYANAYLSLRKLEGDLSKMDSNELGSIPGIGKTILEKIDELLKTEQIQVLTNLQNITPIGVQEMLKIKGLGPKKVKQIWKEMEIETVGELLYACNENRLIAYKGFGEKLQSELKKKIEYFIDSQGKFLYAHVVDTANKLIEKLSVSYSQNIFLLCGEIRRMMPEVGGIEVLTDFVNIDMLLSDSIFEKNEDTEKSTFMGFPVVFYSSEDGNIYHDLFEKSCSLEFYRSFPNLNKSYQTEEQFFTENGILFIPSEYREDPNVIDLYKGTEFPTLIETRDIKGIIHNHSTYSDGLHTLKEMADYVLRCGFEYFVISDHSKSASYANGLSEERVYMQMREIDELNKSYVDGFKIFKSIESDILIDGSLDYRDEVLKDFDLVIASIHSVLNMDVEKATARLIKAVENPYTKILGHPTGRLLLARPGYPVDYKKVIDACAANGVSMELNANPQRLDMDWTWIPYALEKGVYVSINPDAHSKESIHYIRYGVSVSRKGGLDKKSCLNTKTKEEFEDWLNA